MQLRTFLAKDMKAALASVRAEMGPDAVIVASERAKNGVIVRAAVDALPPEEEAPAKPDFETGYREVLIRRLREKAPPIQRRKFHRGELLTAFARHRLPEAFAHVLAEESAKTGLTDMTLALAAALEARVKPLPVDFVRAKGFVLMGPNGAGKTAIAAKLAAHARLAGRPVALIAADTSGAGAVSRLREFAEHLDAAVATAESVEAMTNLMNEGVAHNALTIIDTAGFDPRAPKAAAAYGALAKIAEPLGVISALSDAEEAAELAHALGKLGAKRLIVTSLDLTRRAGALTAAALTQGIRVAHVTRSPFVAGGLEIPAPLWLARLLLGDEG
jgi:flagellar biosynthesis protein FlhF